MPPVEEGSEAIMKRNRIGIFSNIYICLIFFFFYAPIMVMIFFSFNESKSRSHFSGFSLKWYQALLQDEAVLKAFATTLILAVLAALISTLLGTMAAIGIRNYKKVSRTVIMNVTNIPVMNPEIITGVSLMLLFIFVNIRMGFVTLLLAHISFCIPYVILSVLPKLRQLNPNLYDAALDLGASPFKAFFKVILPEIMPGVFTGMLLAFTLSLDDFVISYFTAGSSVQTLPIVIYSMVKKRVTPDMNALSSILFVGVLILLICVNIRQNNGTKKKKRRSEN